ncbi:hypothetical protein GCM10010424_59100 [Streptomyces lienomycini]
MTAAALWLETVLDRRTTPGIAAADAIDRRGGEPAHRPCPGATFGHASRTEKRSRVMAVCDGGGAGGASRP